MFNSTGSKMLHSHQKQLSHTYRNVFLGLDLDFRFNVLLELQ